MPPAPPLTRLPAPLRAALRPLPLTPLSLALSALTRRLVARHPGMVARLGDYGQARFLIEPTDLPFLLLLTPASASVTAHRQPPEHDAHLSGPLSAFLAMLHGTRDGDALFFSRDLRIGGDTSAVLALRNAIDDAELDLTEELAGLMGILAPLLRAGAGPAERLTGLALRRAEGGA